MKSHWLSCKVYKMMEQCGASEGSEWGIERMLELRWHTDPKTGKKHLCSWTDREHKVVEDFEKKRKSGKDTFYSFKTWEDMEAHLHDKPTKERVIGNDEYGNKMIEVTKA